MMKLIVPIVVCIVLLAACDSSSMEIDEGPRLLGPMNWTVWSSDSSLVLRWSPIENIQYYRVEIAEDPLLTKVTDSIRTTETQVTIRPKPLGHHWWRVVPVQWGKDLPSSPIGAFTTEDRAYFNVVLTYTFEFDPDRFAGFESVGITAPEHGLADQVMARGLDEEQMEWIRPRQVRSEWIGGGSAPTIFGDLTFLLRSSDRKWVEIASVAANAPDGTTLSLTTDKVLYAGEDYTGLLRISPRENMPSGMQRVRVTVHATAMAVLRPAPPPPP